MTGQRAYEHDTGPAILKLYETNRERYEKTEVKVIFYLKYIVFTTHYIKTYKKIWNVLQMSKFNYQLVIFLYVLSDTQQVCTLYITSKHLSFKQR